VGTEVGEHLARRPVRPVDRWLVHPDDAAPRLLGQLCRRGRSRRHPAGVAQKPEIGVERFSDGLLRERLLRTFRRYQAKQEVLDRTGGPVRRIELVVGPPQVQQQTEETEVSRATLRATPSLEMSKQEAVL
jgi:hypothetical protein